MSRVWGEIHKPLPVILQKFGQEQKQVFIGTMGCSETSEESLEDDWHNKLDSPLGSGRNLLPLTEVKQHLRGKNACGQAMGPFLPQPQQPFVLAEPVYCLLWIVLPIWHNLKGWTSQLSGCVNVVAVGHFRSCLSRS